MRMHGHAAHDDMKYVPDGAGRGVARARTRSTARRARLRELGVDVDALRAEVQRDDRRGDRRRRSRCRCPTRRRRTDGVFYDGDADVAARRRRRAVERLRGGAA